MYVFGELLKGFRTRSGLTQFALASDLGVDRNTISNWERSEFIPDRDMVLMLEDALSLSHEETDQLLFAANYLLKYQSQSAESRSLIQIKAAIVEEMQVERLQVGSGASVLSIPIHDLQPGSFKLGDNAAAVFPFITEPIRAAYEAAIRALQNSSTGSGTKRGMLVLGVANAGKTRLAFEAVRITLPNWFMLRWSPDRSLLSTMSLELLRDRNLVVFLDDLQAYGPANILMPPIIDSGGDTTYSLSLSPFIDDKYARALRTALADLRQVARNVVVVATCRSEDMERVQAWLGDLIRELEIISLPLFSTDREDPLVGKIIRCFSAEGNIYLNDWDGTIGSLILGLSVKRDQYLQKLVSIQHPGTEVLRSMKLLKLAGIIKHTERRIRAVCSNVFGRHFFQGSQGMWVWRETMRALTRLQLITVELNEEGTEQILGIRTDAYFDQVIIDYPPPNPYQLKQDFLQLNTALLEVKDVEGLMMLGQTLSDLRWHTKALMVFDNILQINPSSQEAWLRKGSCFWILKRFDEALAAFDHVLEINSNTTTAWVFKGLVCLEMKKHDEALAMFESAAATNPDMDDGLGNFFSGSDIAAAMGFLTGGILRQLGRYDEALARLNYTLALVPNDLGTWHVKGKVLIDLKRYDEALATFDHALQIDPNVAEFTYDGLNDDLARLWNERGVALAYLRRYKEALISYEQALTLKPDSAVEWVGKGIVLAQLGRYKKALVALDKALTIDPNDISAWKNKAAVLTRLRQLRKAQIARDRVQALLQGKAATGQE